MPRRKTGRIAGLCGGFADAGRAEKMYQDAGAEFISASLGHNTIGLTPNISMPAKGEANSTTKSAVAQGTIDIRDNPTQDISALSRDTANSLNELGRIFDKQKIEEQQELAAAFGEEAFRLAHNLPDDGSGRKIAVHAIIGGIMSQITGAGFASGAIGAGVNEAVIGEIKKIQDPGTAQIVSAIVGAAAAKAVGGNTGSGASAAASGTKYNFWASAARYVASIAYNFLRSTAIGKAVLEKAEIYSEETFIAAEALVPKIIAEYNTTRGTIANMGKFYPGEGKVIEKVSIEITGFDSHAVARMTERGLSEAMIKNIVESPIVTLSQWNGERLLFIGQEGAAVVEKSTGMVRTTWGVSNFGKNIWEILFDTISFFP